MLWGRRPTWSCAGCLSTAAITAVGCRSACSAARGARTRRVEVVPCSTAAGLNTEACWSPGACRWSTGACPGGARRKHVRNGRQAYAASPTQPGSLLSTPCDVYLFIQGRLYQPTDGGRTCQPRGENMRRSIDVHLMKSNCELMSTATYAQGTLRDDG